MAQLELDWIAISRPTADQKRPARKRSIEEQFAAFHRANPEVFVEMLRLARGRLARNEGRIGCKALWEELRASLEVINDSGSGGGINGPYKLNNNHTALYARMLIDAEPALRGVIELRKRTAR